MREDKFFLIKEKYIIKYPKYYYTNDQGVKVYSLDLVGYEIYLFKYKIYTNIYNWAKLDYKIYGKNKIPNIC